MIKIANPFCEFYGELRPEVLDDIFETWGWMKDLSFC